MAKKRGQPGRPSKPGNVGRVPLYVELDPLLKQAVEDMAAKSRRTLTAEVTLILEQAATAQGLWPRGAPK